MQFVYASNDGSLDRGSNWGLADGHRRAVDELMTDAVLRCGPVLAGPIVRVLSGGKGLRPGVTIAAAGQHDRGIPEPALLAGAAAVELLHWATLVHDDVIDEAPSRHGAPTVNALEGSAQAIVTGDLLIGAAFGLASEAGPAVVRLLATALTELCVGQAREDAHRYDASTSEDDVLAVVSGKTGSLLAAAAQIGGVIGGHPGEVVHALAGFGMAFGISLQLLDDVLDLVSSHPRLGKPVLADFAAGTITLPAVAAMRRAPQLRDLVKPAMTTAECDRATDLLRDGEGLEFAMGQAVAHADRAETILSAQASTVDDIDQRSALLELARWPRTYLTSQMSTKIEPQWEVVLRNVAERATSSERLAV